MYTIFMNSELWHLTHFISGLKIVTNLWTPICICQKRNFFTHVLLEKKSSPSEENILILHDNISLLRSGKKHQPLPVKNFLPSSCLVIKIVPVGTFIDCDSNHQTLALILFMNSIFLDAMASLALTELISRKSDTYSLYKISKLPYLYFTF